MSPNPTNKSNTRDASHRLQEYLEAELRLLGFEILLAEWVGNGGRRTFRLFIDSLDSEKAVSVDDCARMSRAVGNSLEALEEGAKEQGVDAGVLALLRDPYLLEVSSPGIERPLAKRSHFERFCGKKIRLRTEHPLDGDSRQRNFHGTIQQVEDDETAGEGILVLDEQDSERTVRIPLSLIRRANLAYEE